MLLKISEILEHNFFQYFIHQETRKGIAGEKANIYMVNRELKVLKTENEKLDAEIQKLHSRLRDKEMIIELMQKKIICFDLYELFYHHLTSFFVNFLSIKIDFPFFTMLTFVPQFVLAV